MHQGIIYLKVKIKSLAEEARIIRLEERRALSHKDTVLYEGLRWHRLYKVRVAARETQLAYAFLRGKKYEQIEAKTREKPNWVAIEKMIKAYGPSVPVNLKDWYSPSEPYKLEGEAKPGLLARVKSLLQ